MSEMTPETLRAIASSLRNRPLMFPTRIMKLTGHYLDQHSVGVDAAASAWEADRKHLEGAKKLFLEFVRMADAEYEGIAMPRVAALARVWLADLSEESPNG